MKPRKYQRDAKKFAVGRMYVKGEMGAGLFAGMGLGKTYMSLTILQALFELGVINHVLLVAPVRCCYSVWPDEMKKCGINYDYRILHGPKKLRRIRSRVPIHIINPEGLEWLSSVGCLIPYDMLLVDESAFFKTWMSGRSKAIRRLAKDLSIPHSMILTGEPAENSLIDVYPQIWLLDHGKALGRNITTFKDKYCMAAGYRFWSSEVIPERKKFFFRNIAPLVYRLDEADHLDLPPLTENIVYIDLPAEARSVYDQMEQQMFLDLEGGDTLTASNAGAKYAHCRGIANGGFYETEKNIFTKKIEKRIAHHVHNAKIDACEEISEACNGGVMYAYHFHHDLARLKKRKRFRNTPVINGDTSAKESDRIMKGWNARKIREVIVHPGAVAYGVNMQFGGNDFVWLHVPDRPGWYGQGRKRIHRFGVEGEVRMHHILCKNTVDEAVFARITDKRETQRDLLDYLNDYRKGKRL